MAQKYIHIKGARANNLKNIEVKIPHKKMTVITGLSGSGKSTLAFDTLYAEGQRRYVESLSSYARQFLGRFDKPETDFIKGISPAIAIEQKTISSNPRSTVGTVTEIYDYLKIFYARIGKTFSPISGLEVKKNNVADVVNHVVEMEAGTKLLIVCPLVQLPKLGAQKTLNALKDQGFSRVLFNDQVVNLDEVIVEEITPENAFLIIDRIASSKMEDEGNIARIGDSVQLAFVEGNGTCGVFEMRIGSMHLFSSTFELDGMTFMEPTEHFFTFNNPVGACKICEGFGSVLGFDSNLIIPDPRLTFFEGAVACWKTPSHSIYKTQFMSVADKYDFPIHRPINQLSEQELAFLWDGNDEVTGINSFFEWLNSQSYLVQHRVFMSRFRGKTDCHVCKGTRLRKDAGYVKIEGKSIMDIVKMPLDECLVWFNAMQLEGTDAQISKRILPEIQSRFQFLNEVGLGYLTLNRQSGSLSGGESQRINLATSLGSSLVGSMYILDEPSIGLHPRDTAKLVKVLHALRDLGNTVIVVEHEEDIMKAADEILDIGPLAGKNGGHVVFHGTHQELIGKKDSLTAQYLTGKKEIPYPKVRRTSKDYIELIGISKNNLKDVTVKFPLHQLLCVTGVSGSGKSSLIGGALLPLVKNVIDHGWNTIKEINNLGGSFEFLTAIEFIDQNPIGKSSRSNPASYTGTYDLIRDIFAAQPLAKARQYRPGFFSFNVEGGRCEMCEGEGVVTIGMQFMADVHLECEACRGTRFKEETLEVTYHSKSIYDVLKMDVSTAISFFKASNKPADIRIVAKLQPLEDVGLGYLELGQSSSTLSGGEAQRVKLASFIIKSSSNKKTLFIFDEPTTGLHFSDIELLLVAFNRLIDQGHSVIVIEHNLDVIKNADWIIDIGPEGGINGGEIAFQGTPEMLVKEKNNYTATYLKAKIKS